MEEPYEDIIKDAAPVSLLLGGERKCSCRGLPTPAGATGDLIELVAKKMIEERKIRADRAAELVRELSKGPKK